MHTSEQSATDQSIQSFRYFSQYKNEILFNANGKKLNWNFQKYSDKFEELSIFLPLHIFARAQFQYSVCS